MKIQNTGSEALRPGYIPGTRGSTEQEAKPVSPVTPTASTGRAADRVEISDAGRALAASGGATSGALSPERVSELRQRVLAGAYDSVQVVDEIARRMLDRGDI